MNLPEIEHDEWGNPTRESVARYEAAVNAILDADFEDDGDDVLFDVDDYAEDFVQERDDVRLDGGVEAAPTASTAASTRPSTGAGPVHVTATQAWIDDYDARHGLVFDPEPTWWERLPKPRLPRRRERLAEVAVMGSEPLTGVLIPRELGPVVADEAEVPGGTVRHWEAFWGLVSEYAETAAERWSIEAEKRRVERAELLPLVRDAERALRVARRDDPEGKKAATHTAARQLATVKHQVPQPLALVGLEAVGGVGVLGAGLWFEVLPRMTTEAWWWAGSALTALVAGGVWAVVRKVRAFAGGLRPTAEERRLLIRLATAFWTAHAEARGLKDTVTGTATLGAAGITVNVRLDGKWTPSGLAKAEENIRALLGCRTELRIAIEAGDHGGWARMMLRTRLAVDGMDLAWSYATPGFGVNMVTGEEIGNEIAIGRRALLAGTSGAGKSTASRPLLFAASEGDDRALIIIDLKMVEGRLWDHRARVAVTAEQIMRVVGEIVAEMTWRLAMMPKGQATWVPSREHPRLTVFVDEGGELMSEVKKAVAMLESIARMGRAAAIDLSWGTQKPTIDDGIPKQVAPQLILRIGLAVTTGAESRVVFGEDAQAKGWDAENLPMPGVALIRDGAKGRKSKPEPIAVRYMTDEQVIALPDRPIWHGPEPVGKAVGGKGKRGELPAQRGPVEDDVDAAPAGPAATDARVLQLVREAGRPVRQADIAEAAGVSRPTLSRSVKRLVEAGSLAKADDGTLTLAGDLADEN